MDRLKISFDEKIYVHGQHYQFLITKQKYDTSKYTDAYSSLATDVMFTQISAKKGIKQFVERAVVDMFKEY